MIGYTYLLSLIRIFSKLDICSHGDDYDRFGYSRELIYPENVIMHGIDFHDSMANLTILVMCTELLIHT